MKRLVLILLFVAGIAPAFAQSADSDGDGVSDGNDLCPALAGPKSNSGCPEKDAAEKGSPTPSPATAATTPTAPAEKKCFPSGTSLVGGSVSNDGQYVVVTNMAGMAKYFEIRTMQIVAVARQYSDEAAATYKKYFPAAQAEIVNYTLEKSEGPKDEKGDVYGSFKVKSERGETVLAYDNRFIGKYLFEPRTGSLFTIQYRSNRPYRITLYTIGHSPKEFTNDNYIIGSYNVVSPDGRYFISGRGVIFDLQEGRMKPFQEGHTMADEVYVAFRGNSHEFIVPHNKDGIVTFSCATGKRVSAIPIPADMPHIDGFEVVPAPNGEDFLYCMNFRNSIVAGLAYWVHDGKGTSFCDPLWDKEQTDNYVTLITDAVKRFEREALEEAEAARKKALDNAQMDRNLAAQAEYRRQHGAAGNSNSTPANTIAKCAACSGTGQVMQKGISYYKSTREYSSGAGSGSVNYRVTSTPVYSNYAQPTTCRECGGSGRRR